MSWARLWLGVWLTSASCSWAASHEATADAGAQLAAAAVADAAVTTHARDAATQPETSTPEPATHPPRVAADSGTPPEPDTNPDPDDAGPEPAPSCTPPQADTERPVEVLTLEVSREPPLSAPFALAVSTRSGAALSGTLQVCANGAPIASLQLYRGRGSVSLRMLEPGPLQLQALTAGAYGSTRVEVRERPSRRFEPSQDAGAQAYEWTADEDILIEGVQRISDSERLTVRAGTRVLFGDNAILAVTGELQVQGSAEAPVLFTRAGPNAWGGLHLSSGARARIDHAWFVAGGGDPSRAFGHSDSQPVIFVRTSSLDMRGGGLIDNVGKAFGSTNATLDLDHVLISRCDTGGQFEASQLHFTHLHVLELPDADRRLDDDDNDGFYIYHGLSDTTQVEAVIEDSVFAVGEDDAIDHNGAQLRIERVWIEDFEHEGVACSSGREVHIRDSVIRRCEQAVEAGYGAPRVHVEHSLLTANGVGVRYGDNYDWETTGNLEVTHSIITGNDENARNYVPMHMAAVPEALQLRCNVIDDPQFTGQTGNVPPPKAAPWAADSCSDAPLLDAQACETTVAGPRCPR